MTNKVGNQIKILRKAKGVTQEEMGTALGISYQAVSNWERGTAPPDLDNLVKLACLFDITADNLLNTSKFDEPVYLGIDGGATKTEFVVFTPSGKIVKKFRLTS